MRPSSSSLHSTFFSSLKQVQKRLKLEENSAAESSSPPLDSLSAPLHVHVDHESNNNTISLQESSEPPSAFLTSSSNFTPTQQPHSKTTTTGAEDVDDIQTLMKLLGIKDCCGESDKSGEWCDQDSGFYERVVGVKGPKSGKEVERLEGWIRFLLGEREKGNDDESFSLAFLLLGKASCELDVDLEFPSCVEEFLKLDPPKL